MKGRILVFAAVLALVFGCSTVKYIPVETIKEVTVRDSVYFRDTLVRIELEKARISDFVDVSDTLYLSTDLARATAFVDTTRAILRGTIENTKPYVDKPVQVKERIVYRDSITVDEKPVPVEVVKEVRYVPFLVKVLAWTGGIFLVGLILFVLKKLGLFGLCHKM